MNGGKSRTYLVMKNSAYGMVNKVFALVLSFVSRTIFIKMLGAEYLGVNGLYSNILSLLSLSELGIGSVLTFSLYEPIAKGDVEKTSELLNFYKNVYRAIAFVVLAVLIYIQKNTMRLNLLNRTGNIYIHPFPKTKN